MDTIEVFSAKAEKYARYRWEYAPEAIQTIFDQVGLTGDSRVADIGAGTGILTRRFIGKVGQIFAVEPNTAMRAILAKELVDFPSCQVLDGRAEATTLADHSVDLISAAQAVHWFEPKAARREFNRILKPGGWLAFCRNYGTNRQLGEALQDVYPSETNTEALMVGKVQPRSFYFHRGNYSKAEFPFNLQLNWEAFLGSLSTASFAPDEGSAFYPQFERTARSVFEHLSVDGQLKVDVMTELYLGRIAES